MIIGSQDPVQTSHFAPSIAGSLLGRSVSTDTGYSLRGVFNSETNGGERGIRTLGTTVSSTRDFQSRSFSQLGHLSAKNGPLHGISRPKLTASDNLAATESYKVAPVDKYGGSANLFYKLARSSHILRCKIWRRERDSNSRRSDSPSTVFETAPIDQLWHPSTYQRP